MKILETERLLLRELTTADAAFILQLVNEPAWLRFIGDRGVRTLEAARSYLLEGPLAMYRQFGFGLWLVERREGSLPVGICGLLKREVLEDVDLGFAFLSAHWKNGYAYEAAAATVCHGTKTLGLRRIVAVTAPDNASSGRLLEKLGFAPERLVRLREGAPEVKLYAIGA